MNLPKWMKIYNSLLRLKFYVDLQNNQGEVIANLDNLYQKFIDKHGLNPNSTDKVRFFGGDMLIGFAYLTLARTVEYVEKDENLNETEKAEVLKIESWAVYGISTYEDIISKYSINVLDFPATRTNGSFYYTNDVEKLEYFMKKIRNSISHHKYTNPDMDSLILIDDWGGIKMKCVFKYSDFLNFCMDYCFIVNKVLYELHNK